MQLNMREAKTQLARLGELAWQGEEIVITKAGKPYLRLTQYRGAAKARQPDLHKGQIWIAPDFDEMTEDVIDSFYNSPLFPDE